MAEESGQGKKRITVQEKFKQVDRRISELEKELADLRSSIVVESADELPGHMREMEKSLKKGDRITIVVFSGEFDKVVSAFIIANGAVAMGADVNMFFTFWGLNALKKKAKTRGKTLLQRMFGVMLPRGTRKLSTSHFNFMGIGPGIFRHMMKKDGVLSLEELVESAIEMDVHIMTCEMTKNLLGIRDEELIGDFETVGVASYLRNGFLSTMNLFI
jgi:peroxiredoxin family protein